MKKNLKGLCALALSLSILTAALTACGKKIEYNETDGSTNANGSVNIIQGSTAADADSIQSPSDSVQSDSGNSGGYSSGGSYSGSGYSGGSSSGGNYSGNGSSGSSSGRGTTAAASTPDTTEKTTRTPTHKPVDIPKVLNTAKLSPMVTNDAELDAQVEEILAKVTKPGMSNYDIMRAVYDYLVQTNRYGGTMSFNFKTRYYSLYDSDVVGRSKTFLKYKMGNCIDFSAAFMVITRKMGYECYLVTGQILDRFGNSSFHGWNIIRINGKDYGFDSEGDFRATGSGETKYGLFCIDDPVKFDEKYTKVAVSSFKNFRTF